MKIFLKTTLAAAAISLVSAASAPGSTLLNYQITGSSTASFQIENTPTPSFASSVSFRIDDIFDGSGFVSFFSDFFSGGLAFDDGMGTSGNASGEIMFTGSTASPTMIVGTFSLGIPGTNNLTVTVTEVPHAPAVPLPAAGWMLLAGVAGLGALKRRQKAA